MALIRADGAAPVVAETAYDLPPDLSRAGLLQQRALDVEESVATAYASLVASSIGQDRRWPIAQLGLTAVRELALGAEPAMFPGSAEYPES